MKRLMLVAVLTAGCGPMFDSPMAPEPVAWNVTGQPPQPICRKVNSAGTAFLPVSLNDGPIKHPPCPAGWQVPRD